MPGMQLDPLSFDVTAKLTQLQADLDAAQRLVDQFYDKNQGKSVFGGGIGGGGSSASSGQLAGSPSQPASRRSPAIH